MCVYTGSFGTAIVVEVFVSVGESFRGFYVHGVLVKLVVIGGHMLRKKLSKVSCTFGDIRVREKGIRSVIVVRGRKKGGLNREEEGEVKVGVSGEEFGEKARCFGFGGKGMEKRD